MASITIEVPDQLANVFNDYGDQLPIIIEMGMSRLAPLSTKAYMEAIELLTQSPSLEKIAQFRFSAEIETRIGELLEKNASDQLSKAEAVELDRLVQLEEQLQIVKTNAKLKLQ